MYKNKLRIFADCHVFDGTLQGSSTYLKGLYSELIKDKNKLFFLAAFDTRNLESIFGIHENVVYLTYPSKNKFKRLLFDIPQLITKHQIDFAHFQYIVPPIKRCKYIVTTHDVLFMDFPQYFPLAYRIKNKWLFKASARYSDVVLTVSEYSKKQIQHHFGIEKITITPNAVDPIFFETYEKPAAIAQVKSKFKVSNYWLFVSRWEPRKNHDRLLKVFVKGEFYKHSNLVFIGDPAIPNPAYDRFYNTLDEAIKQKIKVLNKVSFEDMVLLVRGASLSVYPSIAEGFGIPPLEALGANVTTICSNTTAMSDFDFIGDCLFNPLDETEFLQKAKQALANPDVSTKRAIVQKKYHWSVAAAQFDKAICE